MEKWQKKISFIYGTFGQSDSTNVLGDILKGIIANLDLSLTISAKTLNQKNGIFAEFWTFKI